MRTSVLAFAALIACSSPGSNGIDGGQAGHDGGITEDSGAHADAAVPSSAVQIIVEPNGNHAQELVSAISSAQQSVYVTFYELDAANLLTALVARARAGVDVEAVLDSSSTNKSFNMSAYTQLTAAGASVVWSSPSFTFTHEKCVIIDGAAAWIMTMNGNTSSPNNREYLAVDTSAADIAEATAVFKADHALQAIAPTGPLVVANVNARPALVQLINSATKTLDVEGEEFSDTNTNGIVLAVAAAARRGVIVHVVVSNGNANANADATVKTAGGLVVVTGPTSSNTSPSNPYIHAKAIVVDCVAGVCAHAFIGSENFTANSLGHNRELGVVFDTASEVAKVKTAIDKDFAAGTPQ